MEYPLDEFNRQKFVHFLPNGSALLLIESAQPLLHQFGASLDVQGVLGNLPWGAWHV
jgi:hypothetical protein